MKWSYKILVHCLIPLFAGAFIYIFFHPPYTSYLFNETPFPLTDSPLKKIFIYFFPDFFWDYSFSAALYFYAYRYSIPYKKILPVIFFLVIGAEVVQLFIPRYFTFDFFDILVALIAILSASLLVIPSHEKDKKIPGV